MSKNHYSLGGKEILLLGIAQIRGGGGLPDFLALLHQLVFGQQKESVSFFEL